MSDVAPDPAFALVTGLGKQAGEPKESDLSVFELGLEAFEVERYVDDFNRAVIGGYRAGTGDAQLPADAAVARSIVPPGTAATRDFSGLSQQLPSLDFQACVGCMTCVNACPDSAILAVALPASQLEPAIGAFAAEQPDPARATETARGHFATTQKYGEVPARRGYEPALFGLFIDPGHCKGCGECVEVCDSLGYHALRMVDKLPREADGVGTVDRYRRDMAFFRRLPPTPAPYRNEKALADIMLGEGAYGYVGGAGSCAVCGEASAIRMMVAATRQLHGDAGMGIDGNHGTSRRLDERNGAAPKQGFPAGPTAHEI